MRIMLHIGLESVGVPRLQSVLAEKRDQLKGKGVLFANSPGARNHTRLFMAVTDPDHVDPLRAARGFVRGDRQAALRDRVVAELAQEVDTHKPDLLILSCEQLGTSLRNRSELVRLHEMLRPLSDDIDLVAHIDAPAPHLARHYAAQVLEGRALPLEAELALAQADDWWTEALRQTPSPDPARGVFTQTQAPCHWVDTKGLIGFWEDVFGAGRLKLRRYDDALFYGRNATEELRATFGIRAQIGKAEVATIPSLPSAASLTRGRQLNALLLRVLAQGQHQIPRALWRQLVQEIAVEGPPLDTALLGAISDRFAQDLKELSKQHSGLKFPKAPASKLWSEPDPMFGFRPSAYLLGAMWRIRKATRHAAPDTPVDGTPHLTPTAKRLLSPAAVMNFAKLQNSPFRPHNKLGSVNEQEPGTPFAPAPPRSLPKGSAGNVIVGCMKNEAPYILEWVAYHRAIGIDNFLIYTNDCEDGTAEILDRLDQMGIAQHRNNDNWKGNSPQQHALNKSLDEAVIKNADWIIHIDVDEFMNIRCSNGTIDDLLTHMPDATNIAMTWRLFGHNGVHQLSDDFVIDQFDRCAPSHCPKPHTVWGFKTMFRNISAYGKISCHRPNKLKKAFEKRVTWVNGSGRDITSDVARNGWRSSKRTIGYDLIQLNHYALRSAESFLIKRQRGRALHVDRSIGLNYWIRMDWSDVSDVTIKRNLPRLRAEYERLLQDETLRHLHKTGLAWHRDKVAELHATPEFAELYAQALDTRLTETERVAFALALDMES